jgi:hypothetical protein
LSEARPSADRPDAAVGLIGLEFSEFEAFVSPIPLAVLRDIVKHTAEGKLLQRTLLKGFRPDNISRAILVRGLFRRTNAMRSITLAAELVRAWERIPEIQQISQALLGRVNALHGPLSVAFVTRARVVLPSDALMVAGQLVGMEQDEAGDQLPLGLDPNGSTDPAGSDHADSLASSGGDEIVHEQAIPDGQLAIANPLDAEETDAANAPPRPLMPLFRTLVDRDAWAWDAGEPGVVGDEDRLLELSNHLRGRTLEPDDAVEYAESVAGRLESAGDYGQAAGYWLAALSILRHARLDEADAEKLACSFLRCRLTSVGVGTHDDSVDHLARLIVGSMNAAAQHDGVLALALLGSINEDMASDCYSPRTRTALASAIPELFPEYRRLVDEKRGQEPPLVVLVRERSKARLAIEQSVAKLMATPTMDVLRRSRGGTIAAIKTLRPFVTAPEQAAFDKLSRLLGSDFTRYDEAPDTDEDVLFADLRSRAAAAIATAATGGFHDAVGLVLPIAACVDSTVVAHHQGQLLAHVAHLSMRVVKPARVESRGWTVELELRNEGPGLASSLVIGVWFGHGTEKTALERQVPHLAAASDILTEWAIPAPDRTSPGVAGEAVVRYRDGLGQHEASFALDVRPGREIDLTALRHLAPYSIRSISDPSRLKGRGDQLNKLREGVQRGSSFTVTGQRRVGKTSLVKVFMAELEDLPRALGLHVSLGEISASAGTPDLGRLGRDLAERLSEAFECRFNTPVGIDIPSLAEFRDAFNSSLAAFIRRFNQAHRGLSIIVAIDDFDELPMPMFTGDAGRQFFLALRALMDKGTCFLFVGSERLPSLIAEQAERLNQVEMLPLDYLDLPSLVALVREPVSEILDFDDEAVERIAAWSARNPYFSTILCTRLWDSALRDQDPTVSRRDVDDAVAQIVETSPRSFYQHFWSDSKYLREEDRGAERSKAFLLLLSLAHRQEGNPFQFVDRSSLVRSAVEMTSEEADLELQRLIQRGVVEPGPADLDVRIRVPLFSAWLSKNGEVEGMTVVPLAAVSHSRSLDLSPEEVTAAVAGLEYRGHRITTDEVRMWARQFGVVEDQRLMLRLLRPIGDLGLCRLEAFNASLIALDAEVRTEASRRGMATEIGKRRQALNYFVTHADETGKSGSSAVTAYRRENHYIDASAGSPQKIVPALPKFGPTVVICVDDFVGTGRSAVDGLERNIIAPLSSVRPAWHDDLLLVYAAITGFEEGLETIRVAFGSDVHVLCARPLSESDRAFHPDNGLFDFSERERAKELAHRYGSLLEKKQPLGYENSQALVVFYDTVPNNSLPILYKSGSVGEHIWTPLFPRL